MEKPVFMHGFQPLRRELDSLERIVKDSPPEDKPELEKILERLASSLEFAEQTILELPAKPEKSVPEKDPEEDIFECFPEPVIVTDEAGTIFRTNAAAESLLLSAKEDLLGKLILELVHDEDREGFRGRISKVLEIGKMIDWELLLSPKKDTTFPVEISCSVSSDKKSEHSRIYWLMRDITARKHSEEMLTAKTRVDATAALAAGVAHDFNNLMVGVLGNAELLQMQNLTKSKRCSVLEDISRAAYQAAELAQQMLLFARGGESESREVNLSDVIRETIRSRKNEFPVSVSIERAIQPDLWNIQGDAVRIAQMLLSLCNNAVEAIGDEPGTVSIDAANIEVTKKVKEPGVSLKPGRYVRLRVSDTGCGMPSEVLTKLFEPFFTTKSRGRGLGLSSVQSIVKAHDGAVAATSEVGRGSEFKVYLAVEEGAAVEPTEERVTVPHGDETILVIEDEKVVRETLRRILKTLGYTVLLAENGEEGIEVMKAGGNNTSLVLLDLGLPGISGVEAFSLLRKMRPELDILICTGYELDVTAQRLLDMGARGFIQKPFEIRDLGRAIRIVLDG